MRNNVVVVATDLAGGIGKDNRLPWPSNVSKEDLASFKELTNGKTLLMGNTTYKSMVSLGIKWGDRMVVVLTSGAERTEDNITWVNTGTMVNLLHAEEPLYVVGGASLLNTEELWETVETVYHTLMTQVYDSDTYLAAEALDYIENNFERAETRKLNDYCTRTTRNRSDRRFN